MFENTNMVIVKVTKQCNLRCKYCYIADKDHYEGHVMSFDTYKKLIDQIILDKRKVIESRKFSPKNTIKNFGREQISVVFHGGEPTTIGPDKLNLFCSYAFNKANEYNIPLKFSMQTNATLLTEEMMQVIKMYDIHLGISFDGAGSSSDARTKKSEFYENVVEKFKKYNIQWGSLMVANKYNADHLEENLDYMKNVFDAKGLKVNYVEDTLNIGDIEIPGKDYFDKITKKLLNLYENRYIMEESNVTDALNAYFRSLFSESPLKGTSNATGNCYIRFCGAGVKIIEIEPDGTVCKCGRYSDSKDPASFTSLDSNNFLGLSQIPNLIKYHLEKHKALLNLHCDLCLAKDICDYGCMAFHQIKYGKYGIRQDIVCPLFKKFKNYIFTHEQELFDAWVDHLPLSSYRGENLRILNISNYVFKIQKNFNQRLTNLLANSKYAYIYDLDYKFGNKTAKESGKTPNLFFKLKNTNN